MLLLYCLLTPHRAMSSLEKHTHGSSLRILRHMLSLLLAVISVAVSHAQMPIKTSVVNQQPPDSADVAFYGRKNGWRTTAEILGFNAGLWAFDRFVEHGDWSYISWETIKNNFTHGFKWDNDKLGSNTFLHPYNGSLYFQAARSNGFNFWQSELFAVGGSALWEMFMECEYPSTNDIIATPVGGAAMGEVLFRASDAILDDRATGLKRFGLEAAAFIVSPMRGFNRIVTGQAWRSRATSGHIFGRPNIFIQLSAGLEVMSFQRKMTHPFVGGMVQLDMEYGDRFEAESTKPYDYFTFRIKLQGMKYQPFLSRVNIKGRLLSKELFDNYRTSGTIGLYQHFDFYDSDTIDNIRKVPYKLGIPASVGAGFMFRDIERSSLQFNGFVHANAILLGSILSDHYDTDERCYNFAQGFSIKAGAYLTLSRDKASLSLTHEYYRLFTWKGYKAGTDLDRINPKTLNVMGDKSVASFNITEARLDVRLFKKLYATACFIYRARSTHYRDFADVRSDNFSLQGMLTWKF